jgi:hypothetical protein
MVEPEFNMPPEGEFWPHTWVVAGDVVISLTQEGAIPDDTWDRFVEDIQRETTTKMLGIGIGAISVNSRQRRKLVAVMHDKRVAAVLGSSVARGIATALSWMGLKIRAFAWKDLAGSLEYLDSPRVTVEQGIEIVQEMLVRAKAPPIDDGGE